MKFMFVVLRYCAIRFFKIHIHEVAYMHIHLAALECTSKAGSASESGAVP